MTTTLSTTRRLLVESTDGYCAFALDRGKGLLLGRDPICSPRIVEPHVADEHLWFHADADGLHVRPRGSSALTWLNGRRLTDATTLHHGDELRFGAGCTLRVRRIEGVSLRRHLIEGRLPTPTALRMFHALTQQLQRVHARGRVVGEFGPSDIFIEDDGVRLLYAGRPTGTTQPENRVSGNPTYHAIDIITGGPWAEPADIYTLGLILYECVTGTRPFRCGPTMQHIQSKLDGTFELPPTLPAAVHTLLGAMLARQPADRPDAVGVRTLIARALSGRGD